VDLYAKGPADSVYQFVATDSTPDATLIFEYKAAEGDGRCLVFSRVLFRAGNVEGAPAGADDSTLVDTTFPTSSASSPQYSTANRSEERRAGKECRAPASGQP